MLPASAEATMKMLKEKLRKIFLHRTTWTLLRRGLFLTVLQEAKENKNTEYFIRIYEGE